MVTRSILVGFYFAKMMGPSYLVVLFQATGGKSGEDLGSDEEQICIFVYLLYDVTNNKVRTMAFISINRFHIFLHAFLTYCR